jgi:hypothetical protein
MTLRASRRPSVCLAIPALTASLGSVTATLNSNWDCAYVDDLPSQLKTIAQEAIDRIMGNRFGLEGFLGLETRMVIIKVTLD